MSKVAKILTIDDDRVVRENIATYLEDSSFQVIEADDGRDGIEKCRRERPDLVLCDLSMPEVDGFQVLNTVSHEFPETPVIIVSGIGIVSDAIKALKQGAWDYVTKPIEDMGVLEHAIEQCLERARLLRENREYREHLETVNAQLKRSLRQLEEDEKAGRRLQFQLLPEDQQILEPFQFSRHLFTSLYLSGDFVDYFAIDADHLGFYMADVSGHGVSSAFVTVLLKSYINRSLERYWQEQDDSILKPDSVLKLFNQELLSCRLGKYLTMFYGVIDKQQNRLSYSNGGQFPFPILVEEARSRYIEGKGVPIGLFDFADYHSEQLDLPNNFAVLLISDGILEILPYANLKDKLDFLLSFQVHHTDLSVESLTRRLGLDQAINLPDDITLMLIKRRV